MLLSLFFLTTLVLPGPALLPTEDDFCPEQHLLQEETLEDHRLYRCMTAAGTVLWAKPWCPAVPRETAQIAAPACTLPDPTGAGPFGLLGLPHFHCDPQTFTWSLQCRDGTGTLLWEAIL